MRICVIHSFYASSRLSGENSVVRDQVALLRDAGHEVLLVGRHTDDESKKPLHTLRVAGWVSTGGGPDPTAEIEAFAPDIVHVHNLFPNVGTLWLKKWKGPIVVSLHNYRFVCSNGMLYREGKVCRDCSLKGNWEAVRHGCYRDSRLATLPLAISRSADRRRVLDRADAVVTTSAFSDAVVKELLHDQVPTVLIPNFGPGAGVPPLPLDERSGWLTMGRLSPEKGFVELLDDWPDGISLEIIGDGECWKQVSSIAQRRGMSLLPSMSREDLREKLPHYRGLAFPSRWPEVAPQVVVEAMRFGLPIVAYRENGVSALVESAGAGRSYDSATSLAEAIQGVDERCEVMSQNAFDYYQRNWRPDVWLRSITRLYDRLVESRRP